MSVEAPPKTLPALAALMLNFERDGAESRRLIGELLEAGHDTFRAAAIEVLRTPDDSRAFQYVITLLVSQGLLLSVLCDSSLKRGQVLAAARAAQRVDPMADVTLAKGLADGVISYSRSIQPRDAGRLLEVLSEISDGSRIMPSLMRLLRHPNPHLRSKAVKMIGRGSRSTRWIQKRLAEPDPRVRANAIESMWGVNTAETRELLLTSVHDSDNRVAGNALFALHRIGDTATLPEFYNLASHDLPRFRCTAAWAMGESGDPRFSEVLVRLLSDPNPQVRARALTSLSRIKDVMGRVRQESAWRLAGTLQDDRKRNLRRLQIVVATEDGSTPPSILGTQFIVTEEGQPVVSYRVVERAAPESMSVSFVFPRTDAATPAADAWVEAALGCRRWKRPSDLWGLQPYIAPMESDDPAPRVNRSYIPEAKEEEEVIPAEEPPRLTPSFETFEEMFSQPFKRSQCSNFWTAVLQAVRSEHGGTRGKRHAIVFNRSRTLGPASGEIVTAIMGGSQVHVISAVPNPLLEEFCQRNRGAWFLAESDGAIVESINAAYLHLLARYEISYTPVCLDCRNVKIRVQTAAGWGEGTIVVPEPA